MNRQQKILLIGAAVFTVGFGALILFMARSVNWTITKVEDSSSVPGQKEPTLATETVVDHVSNVWELAFPGPKTMLYTLRQGQIRGLNLENNEDWLVASPAQLIAIGEGGLLGLALDSRFAANHLIYACYNVQLPSKQFSVRVSRWRLGDDFKTVGEQKDLITAIESQGGRHSGCRLAMDNTEVLWVTTGDSALPSAAQNPSSLAAKVLRVDRDGNAAAGNLGTPFDNRIFSYGHRNLQGLILFDKTAKNGAFGLSVEHGTSRDDEINWLLPGNFGWDPKNGAGAYDEEAPMTDKAKYPEAIPAIWSSGDPTIAPSGATIIKDKKWGAWQGRIAMAVLKGQHVRLLDINLANGNIKSEQKILDTFGRIRTVVNGPDGNLYISTDNGFGQDKIIKIVPSL